MMIKLLEDIIISYGPTRLFKDDVVDLPSAISEPLIQEGKAISLEKKKKATRRKAESTVSEPETEKESDE